MLMDTGCQVSDIEMGNAHTIHTRQTSNVKNFPPTLVMKKSYLSAL